MQKTKLGISVGLLGAVMFLSCLFGGYIVAIVMAGYILLFEENEWLKKSAVKGVALMFGFAVLATVINLIPYTIGFIDSIVNVFGGSFSIPFVSKILTVIDSGLTLIERVLFVLLGLKAFNQGTIKVPVIDSLVDKNID